MIRSARAPRETQLASDSVLERAAGTLGSINNFLLIPLVALMVFEASGQGQDNELSQLYLGFCIVFFTEWLVGLGAATDKREYVLSLSNMSDLLSSIPVGTLFQGFRLVRLLRLLRLFRVVWRTRRFQGRSAKAVRAVALVCSLVLAAAIAFRTVEPQATSGFEEAMWWAVVTLSTVGYGDVMPKTPAGHLVAACVIFCGLGVFGYMAGIMTALLDDHTDDPVRDDVVALRGELADLRAWLSDVHGVTKEGRGSL